MKYRITYTGGEGTIYSVIEEIDDDYELSLGEWEAPFENTEKESTAFGLVESFGQSEDLPPIFWVEEVVKVGVVLISKGPVVI